MKKRITQVDSDTGEVIGDFVAVIQPKRRNAFNRGWVAMSQTAEEWLAINLTRAEDHRVLRMLTARLDWDNMIVLNQSEVAEKMGMAKQSFNQALKRLIKLGVIVEGERVGVHKSYRLNPSFGWKGSAHSHRKESHGLTIIDGGRQ